MENCEIQLLDWCAADFDLELLHKQEKKQPINYPENSPLQESNKTGKIKQLRTKFFKKKQKNIPRKSEKTDKTIKEDELNLFFDDDVLSMVKDLNNSQLNFLYDIISRYNGKRNKKN